VETQEPRFSGRVCPKEEVTKSGRHHRCIKKSNLIKAYQDVIHTDVPIYSIGEMAGFELLRGYS